MSRREVVGKTKRRSVTRAALRAATLGLALLAPHAAFAEVYVQLGNIAGESKDARYPGQIVAHSFGWEIGIADDATTATSTGTFSGQRVNIGPFTLVKSFDRASIPLQVASGSGAHFSSAVITIVREGRGREAIAVYRLTDVIVSSVRVTGQEGQPAVEQVDLRFGRITATYNEYNSSGMPAGSITKDF
jgi:type VI secretion system secreted protein Hcp